MKARVFWVCEGALKSVAPGIWEAFVCLEKPTAVNASPLKVIETEPVLAELQAVREKVFKLSYFGHLESTAMADYASSILDSLDEVIKTLEEK